MKQNLIAGLAGTIFGFGLCLSGMVDPAVVLGFLDIFGTWNPALMFVMTGALLVTTPAFYWILKQKRPVCASTFQVSSIKIIDGPLIIGAIMFGLGWGLAGICPGPAVTAIAFALPKSICFLAFMIGGMAVFEVTSRRLTAPKKVK